MTTKSKQIIAYVAIALLLVLFIGLVLFLSGVFELESAAPVVETLATFEFEQVEGLEVIVKDKSDKEYKLTSALDKFKVGESVTLECCVENADEYWVRSIEINGKTLSSHWYVLESKNVVRIVLEKKPCEVTFTSNFNYFSLIEDGYYECKGKKYPLNVDQYSSFVVGETVTLRLKTFMPIEAIDVNGVSITPVIMASGWQQITFISLPITYIIVKYISGPVERIDYNGVEPTTFYLHKLGFSIERKKIIGSMRLDDTLNGYVVETLNNGDKFILRNGEELTLSYYCANGEWVDLYNYALDYVINDCIVLRYPNIPRSYTFSRITLNYNLLNTSEEWNND